MILTKVPTLLELISSRVDLKYLPSRCQERSSTFRKLGQLELNTNILGTTGLIVLIIKYLLTTCAGCEINQPLVTRSPYISIKEFKLNQLE